MQRPPLSEGIATASGMGQLEDGEGASYTPRAGHILSGKYRLIHVLGAGSMGVVWLAEHVPLRAPVALKLMLPFGESYGEARLRFLREARISCALRSAHVVQVLDYGVDAGTPYIVMERLEGESLAARLERLGSLTWSETVRVIVHVARALERARELGIVHCDIKPQNIFISDDGDEEIVKLLDFGIATRAGAARDTPRGATPRGAAGTPQYMSPEQAECASVDERTDVWALGVVAFECLIGHPPFLASTLEGILAAVQSAPLPTPSARGAVPAAFDAWFQRACARDPERRFAHARTAAHELQRLFAAEDARRSERSRHEASSVTANLCARLFARARRAAS